MASRARDRLWIAGAIKRPGAFRAKAKRAGMSTAAFAAHVRANPQRYETRTKRQAALARTLSKFRGRLRRRRSA